MPSLIKVRNINELKEINASKIRGFIKNQSSFLTTSLDEILGKDHVEQLARAAGFVKRSSLVNGKNFLDLLLSNATQGALLSLEDLSRDFAVAHGESISKQGLDERFNSEAVFFLKSILNKMLDNHLLGTQKSGTKSPFTSCRLRDSTRFGLPQEYASKYKGHGGATQTKSMISIQYKFDLLTGDQVDLQLTSGCQNDQGDSPESIKNVKEGELLIRDLGYVTTMYLSGVMKRKAFFLNRLPSQINVYDPNSKEVISLKNVYKRLIRYSIPYIELDVLIGKKAQLPCRLVVSVCEENAAKKRLERTTKNTNSTGHKVSEETKWRSGLNMYITNAPEEKIHAKNIYQVYRMRWQIELIFKVWKSIANIDKLKKVKIERFVF
ncbi:IS4 family transposase [Perlabentimonas gracilis]|uniref:IS4 family transposase n=1 Tax=Perlabentimonas gracilis TaxID=2715279 RepID=UPI00140BE3D6|nr:IS4 family transposase [Perlabentimonas gracilis]NHB69933.1 IS4 family transposase [Perlabentimonas gracilis]